MTQTVLVQRRLELVPDVKSKAIAQTESFGNYCSYTLSTMGSNSTVVPFVAQKSHKSMVP